jgi:hypothetical protein
MRYTRVKSSTTSIKRFKRPETLKSLFLGWLNWLRTESGSLILPKRTSTTSWIYLSTTKRHCSRFMRHCSLTGLPTIRPVRIHRRWLRAFRSWVWQVLKRVPRPNTTDKRQQLHPQAPLVGSLRLPSPQWPKATRQGNRKDRRSPSLAAHRTASRRA